MGNKFSVKRKEKVKVVEEKREDERSALPKLEKEFSNYEESEDLDIPQKKRLLEHLNSIPFGPQSQGHVSYIRLIHKSSFIAHPIVQRYLIDIFDLLTTFKVTGTISDNIYSDYFAAGFIPEENEVVPPKKLMSILATAEAIEAGTPEDELHEYAKPQKIQQFRLNSSKYRQELESILFWKDNSSDNFCKLFQLTKCPSFTFISHRWSEGGKALGKQNELILFLALAKEEWIWLDCCCVPQDIESFQHGNTMQLIWNIDQYLKYAKNMTAYYCIDGIDGELYDKFSKSSLGLLYLYHLLYPNKYSKSLKQYILNENFNNSSRLWCSLERRFGKKILLSSEEYDSERLRAQFIKDSKKNNHGGGHGLDEIDALESLPSSKSTSSRPTDLRNTGKGAKSTITKRTINYNSDAEEENDNSYDALNNYEIAINRLDKLHAKYHFSLDCFDSNDIEPVTTLLYQHHTIPFFIQDLWPKYLNKQDESRYGILLPDVFPSKKNLYGWYYYNAAIDGLSEGEQEKFFFNCDWPKCPHNEMKGIRLQLHLSCLKKHVNCEKELVYCYHPSENPVLQIALDSAHGFGGPCILCM